MDLRDPGEKIRLFYWVVARNRNQALVICMCQFLVGRDLRLATECHGMRAPACTVVRCAKTKAILFDEVFVGRFKEVIFAVYPAGADGETNCDVFKEVFEALES